MCTLSFVPSQENYLVGMNRDEQLARPSALPPAVFRSEGATAIYPHEPSGGTWIACNDYGNTLALLNWYSAPSNGFHNKQSSRGVVIPELIRQPNLSSTLSRFAVLELRGLAPFRLVGIFPGERKVFEWRWDGSSHQLLQFPWERKHWFSSSLSDSLASRERGRVCELLAAKGETRDAQLLREIHASHIPSPGPFSICVHRKEVGTVSYTQVKCRESEISLSYHAGPVCQNHGMDHVLDLPFSRQQAAHAIA